jgi:protein TonB
MEQPQHSIAAIRTSWLSPNRIGALGASLAIVLGLCWSLATGLAQTLAEKVPELLKAEVLPDKLPDKLPPPPPPDLKIPPPPTLPPPDFVIQSDAAVVDTITTVKGPAKPLISSPVSYGRPHQCQQNYPALSARLGEEGITSLKFTVNTDGHVSDVTISKSSGSERLDNAALGCVANWTYHPAIKEGQPVAIPYGANVKWQLK